MKALTLYTRYALRSFIRGRSRSVFAAFCVAIGIASVVALGLVGGNFHNAVTGDAIQQTRGDLYASASGWAFTTSEYSVFPQLKAQGRIVDYTSRMQDDGGLRAPGRHGPSTVGAVSGIDPHKFPFYDTITAEEPKGKTLAQLLSSPNNTVVSRDTVDTLHLRVGDSIIVDTRRGFHRTYTIAGIVPDNAPDPGFGAGFWNDFAIVDGTTIAPFYRSIGVAATRVYMKTHNAAEAAQVKTYLHHRLGRLTTVKTVADVAGDSKNQSEVMNKFFHIMGLVAVVIGGIGIINTMLVAARRRSKEISVLKSLGMKGRQVVLVFAIESCILALAGTILGVLGGTGISFAVNKATEGIAGYPVPWSLQVEPIVVGALVGIVATVLFAYMPVLKASRARPVAALRSDSESSTRLPRFRPFLRTLRQHPLATAGRGLKKAPMGLVRVPTRPGFRTFWLTIGIAVVMGYGAIIYSDLASGTKAVIIGALVGVGTLVAAAVLSQIFVVVVWLVSKVPTLGRLSLRMAFRSMGTQKRRLASTMLALCVGMLSVGSVALLAQNMKSFMGTAITAQTNMNVILQSPHDPALARRINAEVARLPGIDHTTTGAVSNSAVLESVDGKSAAALLERAAKRKGADSNSLGNAAYNVRGIEARNAAPGQGYEFPMLQGHRLGPADAGTDHMIMSQDSTKALGMKLGSHVVFADGNRHVRFSLVGIYDPMSFTLMANNLADYQYMQRTGLTAPATAHFHTVYLDIRDSAVKADIAALRSDMHGVFVLDLSNFITLMTKSLDKLTLFPEIIAALSLFAGVIIIANTVALAMLERRREIGVMKAVGARRRTILQFLFVENGFVGFLGALAGTSMAMFATAMVDTSFLKISPTFDPRTVAGLLALGVFLSMGASALTALPASTEKPMTVLRYE